MLAEVIEFLQHHPQLHAGALLEHWQDRPGLDTLVAAAGSALALPEDGARAEFRDAIARLLAAANDQRVKALLAQEAAGGLGPAETRELAGLLRRRGKPPK
jgi:hypothetical protein